MVQKGVVLLFFAIINSSLWAQPVDPSLISKNYVPQIIIIKLKKTPSNSRIAEDPFQEITKMLSVEEFIPIFTPHEDGRIAESETGLERIFKLRLSPEEQVWPTVKKLNRLDWIEYAEPLYEDKLLYVPNDPHATPGTGKQYHLTNINVYNAWNLEKGDTNMVVAVVDTGVDIDHPDLAPSIAYNYEDPINGVDDDGDGYVDNYRGWDMADNDNNPNTDGNGHGNIVIGTSSAKTDNGIGLAGVGFNTRFLPVKILQNSSGFLVNSYDGVLYAANQGCQVINLSWGGPWNYSEFNRDIINYVVMEKDAVVVSAAGNTPEEIDFYPASYDNVLSVTSSDESNNFSTWATHSYHVDIMAPGNSIYSANKNGGYSDGGNGTSYSAPMVSGAAALVRSRFPLLDARQVMEQLRVTTDDVSSIGNNGNYEGRIGKGLLNVSRALSDFTMPSIRILAFDFIGNYGDYIFPGDTIRINSTLVNYLNTASNVQSTFSTGENKMTSQEANIASLSLGMYQELNLENWEVVVNDNLEPYSRLLFKADIMANNYSDADYYQLRTAPWFIDLENNDLLLTAASDGDLGYDRDSLYWGEGLWFGANKIADYLGFIISRKDDYLNSNTIYNYDLYSRDQDFEDKGYIRMYNNSIADVDARSIFTEAENADKIGLEIEQKILGWDDLPDNDFFVLEYRLINVSDSTLDSINFAFYADWDVQNPLGNKLTYNPQNRIIYAFDPVENDLFAGVALLNQGDTSFFAIDRANENGHIANFENLFTDSLKRAYSKSNFLKTEAGNLPGGNNVAAIHGYRDIQLNPGESKKIAFVLMAGTSANQLEVLLNRAKNNYHLYLDKPPVENIFYACDGNSATIYFEDSASFEIYQDPGRTILLDSTNQFTTDPLLKDTIYYTVKIINGIRQDIRTSLVKLRFPVADFTTYTDTLLFSRETTDTITFLNRSSDASIFNWNLGNGYLSTVKNPTTTYNSIGNYTIDLIIENDIGCRDSIQKILVVAERSEKPVVENQLICKGEKATLSASNTNAINIYDSPSLINQIFSGQSFTSPTLSITTNYYITNAEGNESLPVKVTVTVSYPNLGFNYSIDTTNLDEKYILNIGNISNEAEVFGWEINGDNFSSETILYNYSNVNEIVIKLNGVDSLACADTIQTTLIPSKSGNNNVMDQEICINENVLISPSPGELFYFYSDPQLSNLVYKGKSFLTGAIRSDTIFYVTNVDSLWEGDASMINITLKPLKAVIRLEPESINLAANSIVNIYDLSEGTTESYWLLSTGSVDFRKEIVLSIDNPGNYPFTLIAKNGENCIDTAWAILNAYYVTGLEETEDLFLVYPNPANDIIYVQIIAKNLETIELLDEAGKVYQHTRLDSADISTVEFDVSALANGIYLLRLQGNGQMHVSKIFVNH